MQQYNPALFNTLQDSCTIQLNSLHYITTVQYNIKYSTSVKESATAQYSCFALESGRLKYPTVSTMICYRVRIGTKDKISNLYRKKTLKDFKSKIKRTKNDTQFSKNNVVMSNQYLTVPFTDHDKQYFLFQNIKFN